MHRLSDQPWFFHQINLIEFYAHLSGLNVIILNTQYLPLGKSTLLFDAHNSLNRQLLVYPFGAGFNVLLFVMITTLIETTGTSVNNIIRVLVSQIM
jgi:hypothetical protein